VTDTISPTGEDTHTGYDAAGHVVQTIDAIGNTTAATYNALG
jgi:hypothetical protein